MAHRCYSMIPSSDVGTSYPPPVPVPPKKTKKNWDSCPSSSHHGKVSWMESSAVLTKIICRSANNNVRDEVLWNRYVQRVIIMAGTMTPEEISVIFYSFARVRLVETLSPLLVKYLNTFCARDLVLILNAHKKLEVRRYDSIELIVNQICLKIPECSALDIALTCNSLGHFQIYHSKFWSKALRRLPRLWQELSGQHAANILGAMAKLDLRDAEALLLLAKAVRRSVKTLPQEMLAIVVNGFARLDFNHSKLSRLFHMAIHKRLDEAAALPDRAQIIGRKNDSFDLQSLTMLAFSSICLTGCSEALTLKMLRYIAPHVGFLGTHKLVKLKSVELTLRLGNPEFVSRLDKELKAFLEKVRHSEYGEVSSRWANEVCWVLKEMCVQVNRRVYADSHCLDILIPDRKVVIKCAGPHSYYSKSTTRTAASKLQQRLLEAQGYKVVILPYFEWGELRSPEEKYRYLWSLGRRAASDMLGRISDHAFNRNQKSSELISAESRPSVIPELSDLSDLSDVDTEVQAKSVGINVTDSANSEYGYVDYSLLLDSASENEIVD